MTDKEQRELEEEYLEEQPLSPEDKELLETIYARLDTTLETVRVIEQARKAAGICFPGD